MKVIVKRGTPLQLWLAWLSRDPHDASLCFGRQHGFETMGIAAWVLYLRLEIQWG